MKWEIALFSQKLFHNQNYCCNPLLAIRNNASLTEALKHWLYFSGHMCCLLVKENEVPVTIRPLINTSVWFDDFDAFVPPQTENNTQAFAPVHSHPLGYHASFPWKILRNISSSLLTRSHWQKSRQDLAVTFANHVKPVRLPQHRRSALYTMWWMRRPLPRSIHRTLKTPFYYSLFK